MDDERILPCRAWKFAPVKYVEIGVEPRFQTTASTAARRDNTLPQREQKTCSCTHHGMENKHDDEGLGTTVIEVTTVTKTTRKKYQVTEE